jgi:hypothetical protein
LRGIERDLGKTTLVKVLVDMLEPTKISKKSN